MGQMVRNGHKEDDYVIEVHERAFSPYCRQNDAIGLLNGPWRDLQSKRHAREPKLTVVACKSRLLAVLWGNLDLQVVSIAVYCIENRGAPE